MLNQIEKFGYKVIVKLFNEHAKDKRFFQVYGRV
jgi:hypothetical protein